jgi:hypothetical protein
VRALGGEVELKDEGEIVYRFEELQRERKALAEVRKAASPAEARAGEVVFSSDGE